MRLWPRKQVYLDDLPKTHDIRFSVLFVVLFVLLIGGVYAAGYLVAGDRLAPGTTIGDVEVGGMRSDEARTALQDELTPRLTEPIELTFGDRTYPIDAQEAGLTFDLEASVDAGLGSSPWDPRHMLEVVTGGEALPVVVDFDPAEFETAIEPIAADVATPYRNAAVDVSGGVPRVTAGVNGQEVDVEALQEALTDALLDGEQTIALPVTAVEPAITATEASNFVRDVVEPAVAREVRIRVANQAVVVPPNVFAPALGVRERAGELELTANVDVLAARSRAILADVRRGPVDARVELQAGRPVVVPSRPGTSVSDDAWATAITQAAAGRGSSRRAAAVMEQTVPARTTAEVRRLGIEQPIASAELRLPGGADVAAVRVAAARLDGVLLEPQQSLAAAPRIGTSSPVEASTVASALFDAAFRAGLGVPERHEPRVRNPDSPDGLDAWIAPGSGLTVVDSTPFGVYVSAAVVPAAGGRDAVRVALWSTPYLEIEMGSSGRYEVDAPTTTRQRGADCRDQRPQTGFETDVSRSFLDNGAVTSRETVHSTYPRIDGVVCR